MKAGWIAPQRTALLLIDCQVDFGAPDGVMAKRGADIGPAQAALVQAQALADAARAARVPVIFVRLITWPDQQTVIAREAIARGADIPQLCAEGTPGADFIGPQPAPGEPIVTKTLYSAFARTDLAQTLHAQGVDTLVLAGLTTECCIQSSAWDGFERGFHVFLAADACAAYDDSLHRGALKALELSGAGIAPTADFIQCWK
jgi:ureidoacrylate peracid hydrolase